MMVLAMDVVRDCTAQGNKACAWCDWEKPPLGEEYSDNVGKGQTTLAAHHASRFVETQNAIEPMTLYEVAAGIETRIAVTATYTKGKQGTAWSGLQNVGYLVIPGGSEHLTMLGPRIAAPGKDRFGGLRVGRVLMQGRRRLRLFVRRAAGRLSRGVHLSFARWRDSYPRLIAIQCFLYYIDAASSDGIDELFLYRPLSVYHRN